MVPPSSTSSSRPEHSSVDRPAALPFGGLPVAGFLAVLLVLATDRWVFADIGFWQRIEELVNSQVSLNSGVVRDRIALDAISHSDEERLQACVMGTSRARRGLLPYWITPRVQDRFDMFYIAHAGMQPFEIRSMVAELIESGVDVVVLSLSEFDTHRPLKITAATGAGSFAALFDFWRFTGLAAVRRSRLDVLRLCTSALLQSYRFRQVERSAGLSELLGFRRPGSGAGPSGIGLGYAIGADGLPGMPEQEGPGGYTVYGMAWSLFYRLADELSERFPDLSLNARRAELRQVVSIAKGVHAGVQMAFLRETADRLNEAGIDVLILELPIYPGVAGYYDTSTREEFLSFARELAQAELVHFVPLNDADPIPDELFVDLTHVTNKGSQRLSNTLVEGLLTIADERDARERLSQD
ncbi:MAG: hypothetical protein ACI9EF_001275 [Pseudohongiellaceae bacterium]|jgi:hypothetical protein